MLGHIGGGIDNDLEIVSSLGCNRARVRICYSKMSKYQEVSFPSLSLWTSILAKALSTFAEYKAFRSGSHIFENQSDSIFRLLIEFGPRFISPVSGLPLNP